MAGSLGDLGGLLRQAQKVQQQVAELQEELKKRVYEGSAGGGAVRVKVTGAKDVTDVSISADAIEAGEAEMLEDLVLTAVRDALRQAEEASAEEMQNLTGGLGLPGLPGMF